MRSALYQLWRPGPVPLRRRAVAFALMLAVHALLLVMLLTLTPPSSPPQEIGPRLISIDLLPEAQPSPTRAKADRKDERASNVAKAVPKQAKAATVPPSHPRSTIWDKIIPLTREEIASADMAIKSSRDIGKTADAAGEASADAGAQGGSASGAGGGPHGERLYDADWYRRPTDAELAYYIPPGAPRTGWGEVACQTVKDYRVENCLEIGQSPPGSGLGGAVLRAAWQFRVLPPRIGGRPVIGAWVRIRIDYTQRTTK